MVKKKKGVQEQIVEVARPIAVEETTPAHNVRASLDEIKTYEGVIGYIMRNTSSAAIDLKDPTKIVDYAILSSSALDASKELAELFDLGEARSIIVGGKDVKMLSVTVGENRISVFMNKTADSDRILRRLHVA
jgi:predicted regulator of Ras-like GTPase activity (Roadblock/LC7/MglB family)